MPSLSYLSSSSAVVNSPWHGNDLGYGQCGNEGAEPRLDTLYVTLEAESPPQHAEKTFPDPPSTNPAALT